MRNKSTRRVISVMLLAVVVYGALVLWGGVGKIALSLQHYRAWTFAAACGLAFLNYVIRYARWEYYLRVLKIDGVPMGESFLTFLSGFVLTVTPGKVGEVFKSLILFQLRGVPIQRTAPIVVAERVTDLIGVIVLITLGSFTFRGGSPGPSLDYLSSSSFWFSWRHQSCPAPFSTSCPGCRLPPVASPQG